MNHRGVIVSSGTGSPFAELNPPYSTIVADPPWHYDDRVIEYGRAARPARPAGPREEPMTDALLTDEERAIIHDLGQIWNRFCKLVGREGSREGDLAEIVIHIHGLQNMLLSQAAARAYPGEYRLLGYTFDGLKEQA